MLVHVMSDDVGRHNIKIYEAFNKFSFALQSTGQIPQSAVGNWGLGSWESTVGSRILFTIRVGVSTEKCCLVNSFGRHRPSQAIPVLNFNVIYFMSWL